MSLKARLWDVAQDAGFAKMGVCKPDAAPETAQRLSAFVEAGYHGQMTWMAERMNWRGSPQDLWPECQSVIMLAEMYTPEHDPRTVLSRPELGAISVYAQNKDYHDVAKKRLKKVGRWLVEQGDIQIKVFVDTAPVMEKPLAQAAGLGLAG
jgi:epoxyqueuosine reductase